MTESMEAKNARNARVSARYDALMAEGKHGHYETMFRVVREEVERAAPEAAEPVAITDAMVEAYLNAQAAYCQKCDRDIRVPFTPVLATRAGLEAAFALSGQAGRDAVEADVRDALLVEAEDLLRTAYNAMMKWGLRDHGSDCGLPHEIRMFALDFSDKGRDGPGELQVRGSGRYRAWLDRLSTPTGRAAE